MNSEWLGIGSEVNERRQREEALADLRGNDIDIVALSERLAKTPDDLFMDDPGKAFQQTVWLEHLTELLTYPEQTDQRRGHWAIAPLHPLRNRNNGEYRTQLQETIATWKHVSPEVYQAAARKLLPALAEAETRLTMSRQAHPNPMNQGLQMEQALLKSHYLALKAVVDGFNGHPEGRIGKTRAYIDIAAAEHEERSSNAPGHKEQKEALAKGRAKFGIPNLKVRTVPGAPAPIKYNRLTGVGESVKKYQVVMAPDDQSGNETVLGDFEVITKARRGQSVPGEKRPVSYRMPDIMRVAAATTAIVAPVVAASSAAAETVHHASPAAAQQRAQVSPVASIPRPRVSSESGPREITIKVPAAPETDGRITSAELKTAVETGTPGEITRTLTQYMQERGLTQDYAAKSQLNERLNAALLLSTARGSLLNNPVYRANVADTMLRINNPDFDPEHITDPGLKELVSFINAHANKLPASSSTQAYKELSAQQFMEGVSFTDASEQQQVQRTSYAFARLNTLVITPTQQQVELTAAQATPSSTTSSQSLPVSETTTLSTADSSVAPEITTDTEAPSATPTSEPSKVSTPAPPSVGVEQPTSSADTTSAPTPSVSEAQSTPPSVTVEQQTAVSPPDIKVTIGSVATQEVNNPSGSDALDAMEKAGPDWKNRAIALKYFMAHGFTAVQAAGLVGNFCTEAAGCELNPSILQGGGGPGRGIAQWGSTVPAYDRFGYGDKGSEVGTLRWYAAQQGTDWTSFETQLGFVVWELNNSEKHAGDLLRQATTVYDATDIVMRDYERPAEDILGPRLSHAQSTYAEYERLSHHASGGGHTESAAAHSKGFYNSENHYVYRGVEFPEVLPKDGDNGRHTRAGYRTAQQILQKEVDNHGGTDPNGQLGSILVDLGSSYIDQSASSGDLVLESDAARTYKQLAAAFEAHFGKPLLATGGYRSYEQQVAAKEAKPDLTASVGTSVHGFGLAADFSTNFVPGDWNSAEYQWLVENAPKYGWDHPAWADADGSKPEPWHWRYTGYFADGADNGGNDSSGTTIGVTIPPVSLGVTVSSSAPSPQPTPSAQTPTPPTVTVKNSDNGTRSAAPDHHSSKGRGTDSSSGTATVAVPPTTQDAGSASDAAPASSGDSQGPESSPATNQTPPAVSVSIGQATVGLSVHIEGGDSGKQSDTSESNIASEMGVDTSDLEQHTNAEGAAYYVLDAKARDQLNINLPAWRSADGFPTGQCTDFVAMKLAARGDDQKLNDWKQQFGARNAYDWANFARQTGMNVDDTPKAGDVLQWDGGSQYAQHKSGHVAFIEKVLSDGTMIISEGNFDDNAGVQSRTVTPAEYASYGSQVHIIHF